MTEDSGGCRYNGLGLADGGHSGRSVKQASTDRSLRARYTAVRIDRTGTYSNHGRLRFARHGGKVRQQTIVFRDEKDVRGRSIRTLMVLLRGSASMFAWTVRSETFAATLAIHAKAVSASLLISCRQLPLK